MWTQRLTLYQTDLGFDQVTLFKKIFVTLCGGGYGSNRQKKTSLAEYCAPRY